MSYTLYEVIFGFNLNGENRKMRRSSLTYEIVFDNEDFAQKYAKRHQKMTEKFGREYEKKLRSRGFKKGRIIDVGCGAGGATIVVAKAFSDAEVVGIDLSEPLLATAEKSAQSANLSKRIIFEKADVQQIPFEENSFDVVINLNMVHFVEDPIKMLDEMERILKPGGILFIADLRRSWLGSFEKEIKASLTLLEARNLFQQSNLREGVFTSSLIWWRFEV